MFCCIGRTSAKRSLFVLCVHGPDDVRCVAEQMRSVRKRQITGQSVPEGELGGQPACQVAFMLSRSICSFVCKNLPKAH